MSTTQQTAALRKEIMKPETEMPYLSFDPYGREKKGEEAGERGGCEMPELYFIFFQTRELLLFSFIILVSHRDTFEEPADSKPIRRHS